MLRSEASAGHLGSTGHADGWSQAASLFGLTLIGVLVLCGVVTWTLHLLEERRLARCRRADLAVELVTIRARRAVLDFQPGPPDAVGAAPRSPGDPISAPDAGRVTGLHSRRRRTVAVLRDEVTAARTA